MKSQGFSIRSGGIMGFVFMVLVLVALFFLAKGVFTLLAWIAPVLIIGTLLINPKTILNYFKFILSLLQRNPLGGIIGIILSVIGFPILSGILFGKALLDRKVRKLNQAYQARESSEFVEYEEVVRSDKETKLDLPPIEKQPQEPKENRYKDLF